MAERMADAVWNGSLKGGNGTFKVGSGAFGGAYSFSTRFEEAPGTNPEELIGAALASCYSMALSASLGEGNFTPESIHTVAKVTLGVIDGKAAITGIHLDTEAKVLGIQKEKFVEIAEVVKKNCPVSVALSHVPMTLVAKLLT